MNDTKGASETSVVAGDKQQAKNKQNIREIYLNAVKNNKGFHRRTKKHAIPSLPKSSSEASFNGSAYLEKEYTLVKRIINDTKELKNIKTKGDVSVKSVDVTTTKSSTSVTSSRPSTATSASYKTPEEYSQELLELKKTLKIYQDNDVVNKAKFDYYDNELSKKEQEIIDLLENKKIEELRTCSDSKADLIATVYNLKQKTYKLEFSLKRKENELNKLKTELKTTNLKELKAQNERLRLELSKALMNDKKIIEAFEKEGLIERNGYSFYDSERRKAESELSLHKKEKMKENLAQQLNEENFDDENQFQAALKDFKHKMPLKGTLKQKLEILDLRENECLKEIERLNANLEKQSVEEKLKLSSSMSSLRKEQHVSRRDDEDEKLDKRHRSVEKLQSVLRGHMERVNSLNRRQQRSDSSDDDRHSSRQSLRGSQQSLLREKFDNRRRREVEAPIDSPPYRDDDRQKRPDSRRRNSSRRPTQIDTSSSSDQSARSDKKIPIDDKNDVSEVETKGGCCSCTKSNKSKKEAKK